MIPAHPPPGTHPAPLVYGDPLFRAATDLARRMTQSGRVRGLLTAAARHPATVMQAVLAVWRLPAVHITISPGQAAAWFAPTFPVIVDGIFHGRRAQAVLDLSGDEDAYLAGRRKQALRTNLRRARRLGVQATRYATYDEWFAAASPIIAFRRGQDFVARMYPPPVTQAMGYYVAADEAGAPVAFGVAAIFDEIAALIGMVSLPQHPAASSSRYLLHTFLRSDLRARGVRHLIVGSAMRVPPGLQYFQHLLGYDVRNLRITVRDAQVESLGALPSGAAAAAA